MIWNDAKRQEQIDLYCDLLCFFCHKRKTWDNGEYQRTYLVVEKDGDAEEIPMDADAEPQVPPGDFENIDSDNLLIFMN